MWADQAFEVAVTKRDIVTVLDVGAGAGEHASAFRARGFFVTTLDTNRDHRPDLCGDPASLLSRKASVWDLVWCSHVLEHQVNPGRFLMACTKLTKSGGWLAVTVPPAKHNIVGGHVSIWNPGLLLYHLVLAGLDCSAAQVGTYGYNISVVVQVRPTSKDQQRAMARCVADHGDIETLAPFFPHPMHQGIDGRLPNHNWPPHGEPSHQPDT